MDQSRPDSFATLLPRISSLYLYHSRHDPVVFTHAQHYAKQLSQPVTRHTRVTITISLKACPSL
ncbi:hypothetical protein M2277_003255 [Paenibacillus sp. LBL]|uniref:hypothetical protein n=1 Tax=Paenibacillus sp. LBL TaxID=2940563 RepID=UPI002473485D|nr:hypothetical protein [Paenibacillus sp. LBL]MDH6672593.1 hypothetical protein [Paenibacillus sp. LBL]